MSPVDVLVNSAPAFLAGIRTTLGVWIIACVLGGCIGVWTGWVRFRLRRRSRLLLLAGETVPAAVKTVPLLVLLIWFHYLLPQVSGPVTPFVTAVVVFTVYVAVAAGDIILGSLVNIPTGELEAAYAVGLSGNEVARHIALPLAFRASVPALAFMAVEILKLTTLASLIALPELLHVTDVIISMEYVALPAYSAVAIVFIGLIAPLQWLAHRTARRYEIRR